MHTIATYIFLTLLLITSAHADERGITREKLKAITQDGETIDLYKESHALLIGISEYAIWPRLDNIPSELDNVAEALEAQNFNIVRLTNPSGRELSNGIEDFIDEYGYERENRILIYFAGHGHSVGDKGFIIPADTPLPEDQGFRRKTVPMSRVLSWARDMEAKHAIFIFDSCFAGTVFKSRNLPDSKERYIRRATALPVRQFITAGSANQEVPAKSTFTPALIRAINGEGDLNNDGYVTGSELGVHLSQLVPRFANQNPQYGKIRDFELAQGDFVFFKQEINVLPPQENTSNQTLEAMLWKSAEQGNTIEEYQAYLSKYPQGNFAGIARARIKKLSKVEPDENPIQLPTVKTGRLTIGVDPPDARIRIMNIVPRYRDGIELELNKRYNILVTREGFKSFRRWIPLTQSDQVESVSLKKIAVNSTKPKLNFPSPDKAANERAFERYRQCNSGSYTDCVYLGAVYELGDGVRRDLGRAVYLYDFACTNKQSRGCKNLGVMYRNGLGVKKDGKRSVEYFNKACKLGDFRACVLQGAMYESGIVGVKLDLRQAITLYKFACGKGDSRGCRNLGDMYKYGTGVSIDLKQSTAFYQQGCNIGDKLSCTRAKSN